MGIYGRHVSSINSFREPRCVSHLPQWQKSEPLTIPSSLTCPEEIKAYVYLTTVDKVRAGDIKKACEITHKQSKDVVKQLLTKHLIQRQGDGLYALKKD